MNFWLTLAGYEAVWFAAVIGAGAGLSWPGLIAALVFATWRFAASRQRGTETRLALTALLAGIAIDVAMAEAGIITYAAPWPWAPSPAWLTAVWFAFAWTIVPLFAYLHQRLGWAALLGAIGGQAAYLAAAHGWHAVTFSAPAWRGIAALAVAWAIALPLLCGSARHWLLHANVAQLTSTSTS